MLIAAQVPAEVRVGREEAVEVGRLGGERTESVVSVLVSIEAGKRGAVRRVRRPEGR